METVSLNPALSMLGIPLLSQLAWEEMLAKWPKESAEKQSNPYSADSIERWRGLRLVKLPGWKKILNCPDDAWVFRYEKIQETIAKRQRKSGEPQNGVFYTSPSVARYLTERTLGRDLQRALKKIQDAMRQGNNALAQAEGQAVQTIRVIDPACGTGVFLVEAMQLFHAFYEAMAQLGPEFIVIHPAHHTLRYHLSGIDLDPLSVMITEFRLARWAARLDDDSWLFRATTDLPFYVGDTLQDRFPSGSDSTEKAGPKKSRWQFILGNPPYITEVRGQAQRFRKLQASSTGYYQSKMDLCDGFLAWGLDHLQPGGQLAYVLPAYWTQRSSTADLRARLWQEGQLLEAWDFEGGALFKNASGHHTGLIIWQKQDMDIEQPALDERVNFPVVQGAEHGAALPLSARPFLCGHGRVEADLVKQNLASGAAVWDPKTRKILMGDAVALGLLAKLSGLLPLLRTTEIQQGLVIPQGRLKPTDRARLPREIQEGLPDESGVFVLNEAERAGLSLCEAEQALLRPFYRPAGFEAFQGFPQKTPFEQIIYTDLKNRRLIEENPGTYTQLRAHLDQFKAVNTSAFAPYGLHRARQSDWFEDETKILAPRQVAAPAFAVVPFPAYVNEGFLVVRAVQDPQWLCAILNSNLAWFWFYHQKRKGLRLQIDKEGLLQFPQPPEVSETLQAACISLAQKLSASAGLYSTRMVWKTELDQLIYQAYQLTSQEIQAVEQQIGCLSMPSAGV